MVSLSFSQIWPPVVGGLAIGFSALLMLAVLGRITGISGIIWQGLSEAFVGRLSATIWRFSFLLGLPVGGLLAHKLFSLPTPDFSHVSLSLVVLSGLLVGVGVRLGSGCTSGHGVCGIARLSPRSITATVVFMITGMLVVFLFR